MTLQQTLAQRDQQAIWHPFTQHQTAALPMPIASGRGAYLYDEQGKAYLDLISSWWVNLHGHSHPAIAQAIYEQALKLEHVIFSGFTHEPAVSLAEKLLALLPSQFTKIFYSDNGSTSIEVALKMAYQYWRNQGETQRKRFMSFKSGYHGDTFGSMSLSKDSGFYTHFKDLFFSVDTFTYPETWMNDDVVELKEQQVLDTLAQHLEVHAKETAAIILEPLVQGASGMKMCRPSFLRQLEALIKSYGILIIYDEVMTGFGRTGSDFACQKANTNPDIICFAKGITGGFLPLAATACHEHIYAAFLDDSVANALIHGHSYTANPLGCAAGLASLELLLHPDTRTQMAMLERVHQQQLQSLMQTGLIEKPRYCGTIAAFDLKMKAGYGSKESTQLREKFLERGLLIRPLGNVFYLLPPYCVTEKQLNHVYDIILQEIQGVKV